MSYIPLHECHNCKPQNWKASKQSSGVYICIKCKTVVHTVLEKYKEGTKNVTTANKG